MGLIGGAIPLVLKDKYSYTEIGYVSLAIYPFSFKVLWSPLVDTVSFVHSFVLHTVLWKTTKLDNSHSILSWDLVSMAESTHQ